MENQKIHLFILLFLLITTSALAQQITELRIKKAMPELQDKPSLYVEVYIPMDMTGFGFNNPIDFDQSELTVFQDDAGTDFLAAHQAAQEKLKDRGYSGDDPIFSFGGVADYSAEKDIMLNLQVASATAADATQITIAGNIVFNFISDKEPAVLEVTGVPLEMAYDDPGFETSIGRIKIKGAGSAELGENSYEKFRVVGATAPIVGVEVIGGDDAEAVKGFWGISPHEFVFGDLPETVDLKIRYSEFKKITVPLDLKFGLGL